MIGKKKCMCPPDIRILPPWAEAGPHSNLDMARICYCAPERAFYAVEYAQATPNTDS